MIATGDDDSAGNSTTGTGFIVAFLDDLSMRVPYKMVRRIIEVLQPRLQELGLSLNPAKTVIFETPEAKAYIDALLASSGETERYPSDMHASEEEGYTIVGTPIGTDKYIESALKQRLDSLESEALIIGRFGHEVDSHVGFTIGRLCTNSRMIFLARTVSPSITKRVFGDHDRIMQDMVFNILDAQHSQDQEWIIETARKLIHTSCKAGGLGFRPLLPLCDAAYTAGILQSVPILQRAIANGASFGVSIAQLANGCPNDPLLHDYISPGAWNSWRQLAGVIEVDDNTSTQTILAWSHRRLMHYHMNHGALKEMQSTLSQVILTQSEKSTVKEWVEKMQTNNANYYKTCWQQHSGPNYHTLVARVITSTEHGSEWVQDTGLRYSQGEIRKGDVSKHWDGPLTNEEYKTALRHRLGLMHTALVATSKRLNGIADSDRRLPNCPCTKCANTRASGIGPAESDRARLDRYGLHAATCNLDGARTTAHHEIVGVLHDIAKKCKSFVVTKEDRIFREESSSQPVQETKPTTTTAQAYDASDRMRLDVVVKHVPHAELKGVLPKSVPPPPEPTPIALGVNVLLDVTMFSPGALINNVGARELSDPSAYFNITSVPKEKKYRDLANKKHMTLFPIPISVYGGIDESGARLIGYLIDKAVASKVQPMAQADHTTARDMSNHRSKLVQSYWRVVATAIQRVLVRNTLRVYGEAVSCSPTSQRHVRTNGTPRH